MVKLTKQKEEYYEKIVTWEREPVYSQLFWGILLFIFGIIYLIVLLANPFAEGQINNNGAHQFIVSIGVITVLTSTLFGGFWLIFDGVGEEKEVKFRRIGK